METPRSRDPDLLRETVLVRYTPLGEPVAARIQDDLLPILSPDERSRWARFHFDRDRWLYLVAHVLLRTTLSSVSSVTPKSFEFRSDAHGRPEIHTPRNARDLRFNLTHTRGLAACVVSRDLEVGIDAESLHRRIHSDLPARYFSASENQILDDLEGDDWKRAFYRIWTLKEAYLKARGLGISVPLNSFSFDITGETVSFSGEEQESWQFHQSTLDTGHVLAIAIGQSPQEQPHIDQCEIRLERLLSASER